MARELPTGCPQSTEAPSTMAMYRIYISKTATTSASAMSRWDMISPACSSRNISRNCACMQACKISSPSPTTRAWTPKSAMEAATIGPRVSTSVTTPEPAPICLASTSNSNSNFKTRLICKKNQRYEKDIVFYNRCHVAHQL